MCSSLDGSEQSWAGELSQNFQPIFILFSILRIGKFSDCLNLANTKSALLNNCGLEDESCVCRGEVFSVRFFFSVRGNLKLLVS